MNHMDQEMGIWSNNDRLLGCGPELPWPQTGWKIRRIRKVCQLKWSNSGALKSWPYIIRVFSLILGVGKSWHPRRFPHLRRVEAMGPEVEFNLNSGETHWQYPKFEKLRNEAHQMSSINVCGLEHQTMWNRYKQVLPQSNQQVIGFNASAEPKKC